MFTFGFGARKCLGQYSAEAMMKYFFYHLIETYELGVPEGDEDGDVLSRDTWVPITKARICMKIL